MPFANASDHWAITWEEVDEACSQLIKSIQELQQAPFKRIIAIGKGGIVPAAIIWQCIPNAKFHVIHITSYTKDGKKEPEFVFGADYLPAGLDSPDTLVVDDICDSGDTFRFLRKYLPNANYAAMLQRNDTEENPNEESDFIGRVVEKGVWVDFPWERKYHEEGD